MLCGANQALHRQHRYSQRDDPPCMYRAVQFRFLQSHSSYVFQCVSVPVTGFPPHLAFQLVRLRFRTGGWFHYRVHVRRPLPMCSDASPHPPKDHTGWPSGTWPGRRLPSSKRYRLVTIRSSHLRVSTSPSASALLPPPMVSLLLPHRHWHSCRCQCFRT